MIRSRLIECAVRIIAKQMRKSRLAGEPSDGTSDGTFLIFSWVLSSNSLVLSFYDRCCFFIFSIGMQSNFSFSERSDFEAYRLFFPLG